jgi:hypothetical protein
MKVLFNKCHRRNFFVALLFSNLGSRNKTTYSELKNLEILRVFSYKVWRSFRYSLQYVESIHAPDLRIKFVKKLVNFNKSVEICQNLPKNYSFSTKQFQQMLWPSGSDLFQQSESLSSILSTHNRIFFFKKTFFKSTKLLNSQQICLKFNISAYNYEMWGIIGFLGSNTESIKQEKNLKCPTHGYLLNLYLLIWNELPLLFRSSHTSTTKSNQIICFIIFQQLF